MGKSGGPMYLYDSGNMIVPLTLYSNNGTCINQNGQIEMRYQRGQNLVYVSYAEATIITTSPIDITDYSNLKIVYKSNSAGRLMRFSIRDYFVTPSNYAGAAASVTHGVSGVHLLFVDFAPPYSSTFQEVSLNISAVNGAKYLYISDITDTGHGTEYPSQDIQKIWLE